MCYKSLTIKFVSLIIFFFLQFIYAQEWQLIGLENEEIDCIEIDHSNPDIIYVGSRSSFSDGTAGKLFKSVDGGTSWDTLLFGTTVRDIDIHPINPNILYATLGLNYLTKAGILKSIDGGETWTKADSGIWITYEVGPSILIIDPANLEKLYAGTRGMSAGGFYISANSGKYWQRIGIDSLNGVRSLAIDPVNTQNLYIGDSFFGCIFKSNNGGYDWYTTTGKPEIGANVLKVKTKYPNTLYAGTPSSGFSISKDFGETWTNRNSGLPSGCYTTDITQSENEIFITVDSDSGNLVYKSHKDTLKWIKFGNITFDQEIRAVTFSTENNTLYLGTLGFYKTNLTTDILFDQDNAFEPSEGLNIYPNPFNLSTYIEYSIKTQSMVKLVIFDLLGRKINTLVNKEQIPGNYSVLFEGKGLSTGLYICYLKTETYIKSRKILFSK